MTTVHPQGRPIAQSNGSLASSYSPGAASPPSYASSSLASPVAVTINNYGAVSAGPAPTNGASPVAMNGTRSVLVGEDDREESTADIKHSVHSALATESSTLLKKPTAPRGKIQEVKVKQDWEVLGPNEKWESKRFYPPIPWTQTFDAVLTSVMLIWLAILILATFNVLPGLLLTPQHYRQFWIFQTVKLSFMLFVALIGGMIVLTFHVKVNYTRKIQHFCAYLLPLFFTEVESSVHQTIWMKLLISWWGYWFTLLSFAVFVYPIRTRIRLVDVMFASLDRPEDRPNTLYWITTQVFLGYIVLSLFAWYCDWSSQAILKTLVFIPVFVTGIGDGLAEPIGIRFGKHKYRTRGFYKDRNKIYTRSYEGSACVFIVGVISCIAFYNTFQNWLQFVLAIATIPINMTLAEAYSPHTWDTPFLLLTGCSLLWAITFVDI